MLTENLNASAGIDPGSHSSKIACSDSNGEKIIDTLKNFNLIELREAAEIFFDEPVFSCVVAMPSGYTNRQRDEIIFLGRKAGFKNLNVISSNEAINLVLEASSSSLVYDFGASRSEIKIFEAGKILADEIISDVSGNEFDKIFAAWLSERFNLNLIAPQVLLEHAEKIKITLSSEPSVSWRGVEIFREDFERLIFFMIKRALHTVERMAKIFRPENFIITGGCSEIPAVKKIFCEKFNFEFIEGLIAKGAALEARRLSKDNKPHERQEAAAKIRELRAKIIALEDFLTRPQKDRLYFLFRQAEGINDPNIIILMENLVREIQEARDEL